MFFMALFNIVFLSAPIKTTFKKANNFKNDDPTSLSSYTPLITPQARFGLTFMTNIRNRP